MRAVGQVGIPKGPSPHGRPDSGQKVVEVTSGEPHPNFTLYD